MPLINPCPVVVQKRPVNTNVPREVRLEGGIKARESSIINVGVDEVDGGCAKGDSYVRDVVHSDSKPDNAQNQSRILVRLSSVQNHGKGKFGVGWGIPYIFLEPCCSSREIRKQVGSCLARLRESPRRQCVLLYEVLRAEYQRQPSTIDQSARQQQSSNTAMTKTTANFRVSLPLSCAVRDVTEPHAARTIYLCTDLQKIDYAASLRSVSLRAQMLP